MLNKIIHKIKGLVAEYKHSEFCKNVKCIENRWMNKINNWGKELAASGVNANMVSIFGFVIGMMAINFLAMNMYFEALACILINRFCDILDGAVARVEGVTPFGMFLDVCLDFVFYAGIIFGFALADPYENATAACFLLFGFTASSSALLAYGIVNHKSLEKKDNMVTESPFYLGGIAQGFETVCAFVLLCVVPFAFLPIAIALGCWCLLKALVIISSAYYKLVVLQKSKK